MTGGLRLLLRAEDYAWIVAAQLRAFTAAPDPARWLSGTATPVVLVPGVWETWPVLRELGDALHEAGHPVHTVPALGTNSADLDGSARLVRDRLLELDLERVVLVAHSKGGLIAKSAFALPEVDSRVVGLVTIATPFAGSTYARWFPARAVRRLSPRDPVMRELAADVRSHPRILALRPRFDPHIPRAAGAPALAGAVEVELPLDGHFLPLGDPVLHDAVVRAVRGFSDGASGAHVHVQE
ncbi:esterase/lipase family protein [Kineococcus sp. SYSU DK018]|uniref:esterase/lipase family protein n=1 Tax=Kineococcus sp. SYSU DK018 TaxID=3383139 RepID=UPI003D7CAC84